MKLGVDEYVGLSCDEYVTDTGQSKGHGMKRREVHRMKGGSQRTDGGVKLGSPLRRA